MDGKPPRSSKDLQARYGIKKKTPEEIAAATAPKEPPIAVAPPVEPTVVVEVVAPPTKKKKGKGPPQPPRKSSKPPVIGTEKLRAACGCWIDFELFDLKSDKFRKERRLKKTGKGCSACRMKAATERQRIDKAARERRLEMSRNHWKQKASRSAKRLPHGSGFAVTYDGARIEWTGTLTIVLPWGEEIAFLGKQSGVFRLLAYLDNQYRQYLEILDLLYGPEVTASKVEEIVGPKAEVPIVPGEATEGK